MAALIDGQPWQDVLGHRVLLGDPPTGAAGTAGDWDASLWDAGLWGEGFAPVFRDITVSLLSAHTSSGAQGLDLQPGVGTVELTLWDGDGAFSPDGSTDWLLGLHVRGYVTPIGRPEHPAFYGIVDKAEAGGTFAAPTVNVTAYDTRSLVAAASTTTPIADQAETAQVRLTNILDAAGFPTDHAVIETDLTPLLADDTLGLGDLFSRTVESAAGLAWADGAGAIHTRNRDWIHGTGSPTYAAYIYAGNPQVEHRYTPAAGAVSANVATFTGHTPASAVDKDPSTWWQPVSTVAPTRPAFIVDRGPGAMPLLGVHCTWWGPGYQAVDYSVVASPDGSTGWHALASVAGNASTDRTDRFAPAPDRVVALDISTWGGNDPSGYANLALLEIELIEQVAFPVAQTTDLSASQAISTVANQITYANRDDPPVTVTVTDLALVARYGARSLKVDDLACDLALLEDLAAWSLELHRDPLTVCEGATVTVYDADTAAIAGLSLADPVVVGRNDPAGARWELPGIVAGLELDISPDTFQVAVTVTNAASLGGTTGAWDSGVWSFNRWAAA